MKPLTHILLALLLGSIATAAFASEGLPPDVFEAEQIGPTVGPKAETKSPTTDQVANVFATLPAIYDVESRMRAMEADIEELKRTRVTAEQARAIAKEEIAKVTVALRTASGQIRTQQVSQTSNYQGAFDMRPGETLLGYTDPDSGQYVDLTRQRQYQQPHRSYGAPVQYYDGPGYQFAVTPPTQYGQPRRAAFRSTCRIVNGRRVCN